MTFSPKPPFQIRDWLEFDHKGRTQCPCCGKDDKDRTLSLVPNSEFGYKCFRGCSAADIREALGIPSPGQYSSHSSQNKYRTPIPPDKDYTVDQNHVKRAVHRLLFDKTETAKQAREWLFARGIKEEDIRLLNIGLGERLIIPNENKPHEKETYGAICIFIPIPNNNERYYVKKRVAPWLKDNQRPHYVGRWSQYGVPSTIWFTYLPSEATETWFCEGEWDAIRLAQLAREEKALIAICCSTAGCGSVPRPEELARLPGMVTIFYDRNDKPKTDGTRAGDEGARKLALALNGQGKIADVPMPSGCEVNGWDVSNAIDEGYTWSDFLSCATDAITIPPYEESDEDSTQTRGKVVAHPTFVPLNFEQVRQQINHLIEQEPPRSELSAILPAIAQQSGYSIGSVWKIYNERLSEIEIEEERETTAAMIDALLKAKQASINLHEVLPSNLAAPLLQFGNWLQVRPEAILLTLLTVVSSLHHAQTISWLNRDWDFSVKPNLYSAIVAPASQKKSPIVKTIARKPLSILEKKAKEQWKKQEQDYKEQERFYESLDKEQRKEHFPNGLLESPPNRRQVHSFTKTTAEGLRNQVQNYPNQGLLAIPDELAGLFKSANAYRGGKGSDDEDLLSYYDGTGETVLRADGLAGDFDNLLLSILGTIQPKVLQKFLEDCQDSNGRWARFMFVNQPLTPSYMSGDGGSFDLTPMLADLYQKVNELPPTEYRPDKEAFKYYCGVYNELERRRCQDTSPAMSAVWGKAEGRIGKIATNLHVIHALMAGQIPEQSIPKQRYVEAVLISLFFIQQVFSLYNELGEPDAIATHLTKIIELSAKKGWLSARDVQLGYDRKSRPRPDNIRTWFKELQFMGKGTTQGEGRYLKFRASNVGVVGEEVGEAPTEFSFNLSRFQPNVGVVGESGVFSEKIPQAEYYAQFAQINNQTKTNLSLVNNAQVLFQEKNDISPTNSTNSTNGYKADGVEVSIVGSLSTNSPTNSTNNQIVEEIVNSFVGEESTFSANGQIAEEIVNSFVGEELTISISGQIVEEIVNSFVGEELTISISGQIVEEIVNSFVGEELTISTNLTGMTEENTYSLDLENDEEIATVQLEDPQEIETNVQYFNPSGHLSELQQLLLMCLSLFDLLDILQICSPEELMEAYKTLNIYERKQIRQLIKTEEGLINVSGQMMTPCQLLSLFAGQPDKTIKVGDKVLWRECSGHLESWSPFEVLEIQEDGWVRLDIVFELVPLCELRLCLPTT